MDITINPINDAPVLDGIGDLDFDEDIPYSFNVNATCKFKNTTSNDEVNYTIQESINVNDIEGHVIRMLTRPSARRLS